MKCILIIDDDPAVQSLMSAILRKKGYDVLLARDGKEGLEQVKGRRPDLVITDYQMPGMSGMEVLSDLRQIDPGLPVIMLTAHGDASLTIKSIQSGAFDYIEKPINPRELLETVKNGLETLETVTSLPGPLLQKRAVRHDDNLMVGKSAAMQEIFKNIGRFSQNNVNVLITGETGTGKERLARLIHQSGRHRNDPLVWINCITLENEQYLASQAKRSGRDTSRLRGLWPSELNQVGSGTIVLHAVDKLSPQMQTRLLDLLDEYGHDYGEAVSPKPRFISISSRDVNRLAASDDFLKELYYKLNVFSIHVPPLRERKDDIPELVRHLLQQMNPAFNKSIDKLEDGLIQLLQSHDWPGNVRELKNVLMKALVLSQGELLEKKHIHIEGLHHAQAPAVKDGEARLASLAEMEKEQIGHVLDMVGWNKQEAASILGITRPTLNAKIGKYGLKRG